VEKTPFHLLVCDFDNCLRSSYPLIADSCQLSWPEQVDDLRENGRNVTCQPIPAVAAVEHKHVVERFCTQHGLRLIDKPPPGMKMGKGEG
jgi:hypothetical protein